MIFFLHAWHSNLSNIFTSKWLTDVIECTHFDNNRILQCIYTGELAYVILSFRNGIKCTTRFFFFGLSHFSLRLRDGEVEKWHMQPICVCVEVKFCSNVCELVCVCFQCANIPLNWGTLAMQRKRIIPEANSHYFNYHVFGNTHT